jgi:hypothetical protein
MVEESDVVSEAMRMGLNAGRALQQKEVCMRRNVFMGKQLMYIQNSHIH